MKIRDRGENEAGEGAVISINPLEVPGSDEGVKKGLLELQLKMATCSINHEYARMEFDDIDDRERREELLEYMNECRSQYLNARHELNAYDPYALAEFEADLLRQKQTTIAVFEA